MANEMDLKVSDDRRALGANVLNVSTRSRCGCVFGSARVTNTRACHFLRTFGTGGDERWKRSSTLNGCGIERAVCGRPWPHVAPIMTVIVALELRCNNCRNQYLLCI